MKKLKKLVLVLICLSPFIGICQAIVSDPKLLQSMETKAKMDKVAFAKQLEEAKRTFMESKTIRENIDAGLKKVEHVSSYVQNSQQVANIKTLMVEITREYYKGINFIQRQPVSTGIVTTKDVNKFHIIYKNMLAESVSDLKNCSAIVSTGFINMDDASRLMALENIEKKLSEKRQLLSYLNNKIAYAVQEKKTEIANKRAIAAERLATIKKKL